MKFILVKALLIFGYLTSFAENNPTYFFVVAKKGDGALSLLRKYRLDEYECNINQFYRINKLKKKEHLQLNKKYKLPMLVYEFNDVNIRTTIDNDNYELAKQVEAYNEKMLADKIKKSSFKFDKQLWVPFHIFNCEELVKVAPDSPNNNRSFPIFGKAYEYVPIEDKSLSGRVFYIVSGHGGPDPGAMGKHGSHTLCEDEYAYDV
ncbi:MAG: N-acetylmuramoyl-L-alanine amidase, partial [Saprospiraceae bacterium]